jgi:hypothetical protein
MLNKVIISRFCFNPNLLNSWRKTGRLSKRYASRKSKNGVYRRRYNHQLDKEFDSPNALNFMKTKSSIQSQTQWKEKSRKTEVQVGEWGE